MIHQYFNCERMHCCKPNWDSSSSSLPSYISPKKAFNKSAHKKFERLTPRLFLTSTFVGDWILKLPAYTSGKFWIKKPHDLETLPMLLKSNLLEWKLLRYEQPIWTCYYGPFVDSRSDMTRMNRVSSNMTRMQHKIFFYQVRSIGSTSKCHLSATVIAAGKHLLATVHNSDYLSLFQIYQIIDKIC